MFVHKESKIYKVRACYFQYIYIAYLVLHMYLLVILTLIWQTQCIVGRFQNGEIKNILLIYHFLIYYHHRSYKIYQLNNLLNQNYQYHPFLILHS